MMVCTADTRSLRPPSQVRTSCGTALCGFHNTGLARALHCPAVGDMSRLPTSVERADLGDVSHCRDWGHWWFPYKIRWLPLQADLEVAHHCQDLLIEQPLE